MNRELVGKSSDSLFTDTAEIIHPLYYTHVYICFPFYLKLNFIAPNGDSSRRIATKNSNNSCQS